MHLYLQGLQSENSPCKLIVLKIGCTHIFIIYILILMRQPGRVRPACRTLATCWISSRLSWVQTLGHACKIANWFDSIIINCTVSTTAVVFSVITCSRLLFLLRNNWLDWSTPCTLPGLILLNCFKRPVSAHIQCTYIVCTIKPTFIKQTQGSSEWKYVYSSCKLTVSISSLRNNWLGWWTLCTAPALILFAASFPMNTRRLAWLNQALSYTSSGVMVC